jgi:hypothetical protein
VNPTNSVITVSQAQIFNNTSWDLWTQDWRAQLMPVQDWADWSDRLRVGIGDADRTCGAITQTEVEKAYDYVSRIPAELAEVYLNH